MNISLNWLATHLDLSGKSIKEIDDLFTFAGVEVEGLVSKGIASDKIVVAQIMEAVQHPNADRLKVTQVDCGEGVLRQIVCGAQNYQVGDKVPCALPGAELPGGFTISETVMRKVASRGMLCAASEIGLPAGEDGLLILPEDSKIGVPVKNLFDSDTLLELEVTPNRPDLLSHRGMARELAVLLKTPLLPIEISSRPTEIEGKISIEAPDACPLYSVVRIAGVTVGDSPGWLKQRLESIGLRPINNIVDVTNYVLHELGQPLHAFDAAKISGNLVVRHAEEGEAFLALDESTYRLAAEDLVISDESRQVLALAGVMGGMSSGVTAGTTDILLESAYFEPQGIRRTSRRTSLTSDSAYRFERGVDPEGVLAASAFAVQLITEIAGGDAESITSASGEIPLLTGVVRLDAFKLDQLTGSSISLAQAGDILTRLGLEPLGEGDWKIPSFRADLQRHIDLVEEVVRVHGLANIPSRLMGSFVPASAVDGAYDADMILRRRLAALGVHECQTIKLISETQVADALPLRPMQEGDLIRVKLPLSEDHSIMRPSIVPGLIASAARNVRQQAKSLRFFEMGRVFRNAGGGKARDQESETLAILLGGSVQPSGWSQVERAADLHDLKGLLSAVLGERKVGFTPKERVGFVLSCDVKVGDQTIGVFARLAPARERELDFPAVFVAELDLAKLRKLISSTDQVEELPQFPGSSRDAAMEVPLSTAIAKIDAVISNVAEPLLVAAECFDVFVDAAGQMIAADLKSVAYRFTYRDATRTLKANEVDIAHGKILELLTKNLGVKFR